MDKSVIRQYLSAGKRLTLLNNKAPVLSDWLHRDVSYKKLAAYSGNLGWVLGPEDLVIDVDPRHGGDKSFKKLVRELKKNGYDELEPTVITPSGGFHVYLSIPDEYELTSLKSKHNDYPGIDFLTVGKQCVIPGSKTEKGIYDWYDDISGSFEQIKSPDYIMSKLSKKKRKSSSDDFTEGEVGGDCSHYSQDKVEEILGQIDPSIDYDRWLQVGMACHDWDPKQGYEVWEQWSKAGDNYEKGACRGKWKTFKVGGGITLRTISYMAREFAQDNESKKVSEYLLQIREASEHELDYKIPPEIRKEIFDKVTIDKLANAMKDRYKEHDKKVTVTSIKHKITRLHQRQETAMPNEKMLEMNDDGIPNWCARWVYIDSHACYFNLETLEMCKTEAFNNKNTIHVPFGDANSKPSAAVYAAQRGFIKNVDTIAYLPMKKDVICEIDGRTIVNAFNHNTLTKAAGEYTDEGWEYCQKVVNHIRLLMGNERDTKILLQWIAHQVQFPGELIRWAVFIEGVQGIGKTFIANVVTTMVGDRNVNFVNPSNIGTGFNGWQTGSLVNCYEELRVQGHNRYEIINQLKPSITDRMLQINEKGVKPYMTYNTTNSMAFSNFKDALPLGTGDRRWFVKFAPFASREAFEKAIGIPREEYFNILFDGLELYPDQLTKFFMEYEITEEFKNLKEAPMTEEKRQMIATEEYAFEGLLELKELIEEGGPYWNSECISSGDLFRELESKYPEIIVNTRTRHILLKKLGFTAVKNPMTIDGKTRRIWTKTPMSNESIRMSFKGSGIYLDDL